MFLNENIYLGEPIAYAGASSAYYRSPASFRGYPAAYDPNFGYRMVRPHVESYNTFLRSLDLIAQNAISITTADTKVRIKSLYIYRPLWLPYTCRELLQTYAGAFSATLEVTNLSTQQTFDLTQPLCELPVMLGSNLSIKHNDNVRCHEDERDCGGYFIVNGGEKMVRLLILPRRHYLFSCRRAAFQKRGTNFTDCGIYFRSVRSDQRSQTLVLHALKDGSACLRVLIRKREFFIPLLLLLRGLKQVSDKEIYEQILSGEQDPEIITYITERLGMMFASYRSFGLWRYESVYEYLGQRFGVTMGITEGQMSNADAGRMFLERHIFWHLGANLSDKFYLLCQMTKQLYYFTFNKIYADSSDSTAFHEILTSGLLLQMIVSECADDYMTSIKYAIDRLVGLRLYDCSKDCFVKNKIAVQRTFSRVASMIATGNLNSTTGLDLMQMNAFSVTADRLNYVRFMAHFRSVHRGAFFTEMKTTAVRKMIPESFGFLCVVHTPDGAPCGLLNHLCRDCDVCQQSDVFGGDKVIQLIEESGLAEPADFAGFGAGISAVPCFVDGVLIGYLPELELHDIEGRSGNCFALMQKLRQMKGSGEIGNATEICYIPSKNYVQMMGQFTVFTQQYRYARQVLNLSTKKVECIGSLEQLFLDIAMLHNEINTAYTTHQELTPVSMLSATAQLVPWPDHNQSPRNVYECQMLKQTMGFPSRAIGYTLEAKTYRIMTPYRPMVRTYQHDIGGFDTHPTGTNAIVAVMAYTGYDMEDACLLNKKSLERGIFHGCVYTVHTIDLQEELHYSRFTYKTPFFQAASADNQIAEDGLPYVGAHITKGDRLAFYYDPETLTYKNILYKKEESGVVERVIVSQRKGKANFARIVIRHDRSPIIGDKFAARHGYKGTLSIKFPGSDMPFCHVSGMYPDLIINPHAFPSRMTIGMLLESLAGKYCAHSGVYADATPFYYSNERRCLDEYGSLVESYGYSRYGSEQMYSGITGKAMECQIFIGPVYYQRLRHMVNDKYQVRAVGPKDGYTGQPIKGRSRGGGTRFGEMERDALIAHGTAELLRGRLCCESDGKVMRVCSTCGCIFIKDTRCLACGGNTVSCYMPQAAYVLIGELAGMGIRMNVRVK